MTIKDLQLMLFPGRYIQGPGALDLLPEVMARFGTRPFILATPSMLPVPVRLFGDDGLVAEFRGECTNAEVQRITDLAAGYEATALAAVGGGKTIDTCKIAADRLGLPVVAAPTIASTDAPCSSCAVVYTPDGAFDNVLYQRHNPDVVLVDTRIIAAAPLRFLVSGMGDALSTWFEAEACQQSGGSSECGGQRTATAMALARLCLDILLEKGLQAVLDLKDGRLTPEVEAIIEANTLLSGIGFESCGLAGAHAIHNGLTVLSGTHSRYHGEKVAFGIVATLQLRDPQSMSDRIFEFLLDLGLPVCFEDLGIPEITDQEILLAAEAACRPGSSLYHEPVPVTAEIVAGAMKAADAIGRKKKADRVF